MKKNNLIRWIVNIIFIILFGLVTFFGIGPVLLADGSLQERLITLGVVILIYIALIIGIVFWNRLMKRNVDKS